MTVLNVKKRREVYIEFCHCLESDSLATISKSDKHLNFVIAFMTERRMNDSLYLSVCTKVRYNNRMGKFYFTIIKPFHKLICKTLLKQVRRNFELS